MFNIAGLLMGFLPIAIFATDRYLSSSSSFNHIVLLQKDTRWRMGQIGVFLFLYVWNLATNPSHPARKKNHKQWDRFIQMEMNNSIWNTHIFVTY